MYNICRADNFATVYGAFRAVLYKFNFFIGNAIDSDRASPISYVSGPFYDICRKFTTANNSVANYAFTVVYNVF